jgi:hypothetical protein
MVGHWKREGGPGARRSMLVNGVGAFATGVTVVVVLAAKFMEGAWITMLLIPSLVILMHSVRNHYHGVLLEMRNPTPLECEKLTAPLVVVPVQHWNNITKKALRFAMKISPEITALYVDIGEVSDALCSDWKRLVEEPAFRAGAGKPKLVILKSHYRFILAPIVDYVLELERTHPDRQIAVLVPELVERHWYHHLLHNKRAAVLKGLLLVRGNQRIVVINVPWYLES